MKLYEIIKHQIIHANNNNNNNNNIINENILTNKIIIKYRDNTVKYIELPNNLQSNLPFIFTYYSNCDYNYDGDLNKISPILTYIDNHICKIKLIRNSDISTIVFINKRKYDVNTLLNDNYLNDCYANIDTTKFYNYAVSGYIIKLTDGSYIKKDIKIPQYTESFIVSVYQKGKDKSHATSATYSHDNVEIEVKNALTFIQNIIKNDETIEEIIFANKLNYNDHRGNYNKIFFDSKYIINDYIQHFI